MSEILNTFEQFPSFQRWSDFVGKQSHYMSSSPEQVSKLSMKNRLTFRTAIGVNNSLGFYNKKYPTDIDFVPNHLSQEYDKPNEEYTIVNNIYEKDLLNQICIYHENDYIKYISAVSKSENNSSPNQTVFLALNSNYLNELILTNQLPKNSGQKIRINQMQDNLTIKISDSQSNLNAALDENVLLKILSDAQLDLRFDTANNTTQIKSRGSQFTIHNVSSVNLDADTIWKTLTGANPKNPFIFPVDIVHDPITK